MNTGVNIEENGGDDVLKRVTICLPKEVHDLAVAAAESEERSLSNFVSRLIRRSLEEAAKAQEVAS